MIKYPEIEHQFVLKFRTASPFGFELVSAVNREAMPSILKTASSDLDLQEFYLIIKRLFSYISFLEKDGPFEESVSAKLQVM